MGNSCINQLRFLIFLIASLAGAYQSNGFRYLSPKPRVPLFVFGDSIYDPGNNNYINTTPDFLANFLPYGETFFEFATGRFSDGRLIPDFIAKYAKLPLIPPYFQSSYRQFVYGVNFASGGGGALVETHEGKAIDLKTQLRYFKNVEKQLRRELGTEGTDRLLSNAVYMFSIGGNDLLAPNPIFSSFSTEEYVGIIVGNFTEVLEEVYKAGGRKFGFLSLLPLGCLPYVRAHNAEGNGETCVKDLTDLAKSYNAALAQKFKQLQKQLKGFIYSNFDFFNAVSQRLSNPSKYGFKEVKSGCCGSGAYRGNYTCGGKRGDAAYDLCDNPDEHFFFDSYHPSETAYHQFAGLMWNGPPSVTGPRSLKSLFEV
nr:GDSL esterase/lipase 1-like isoform X1 [Coffea arabica]